MTSYWSISMSEYRSFDGGLAVNLWPWCGLEDGGGGRGRILGLSGSVQGQMMAEKIGQWAVWSVFCLWGVSTSPTMLPPIAGECQWEVTYFMSHLKRSLLTIEECRKSEELVNTIKYSHMFVDKICLFSFGHHDMESPVWLQVRGRLEERWDHLKTSPKTPNTTHITQWPAPYQTAETLYVNSSFLWLSFSQSFEKMFSQDLRCC